MGGTESQNGGTDSRGQGVGNRAVQGTLRVRKQSWKGGQRSLGVRQTGLGGGRLLGSEWEDLGAPGVGPGDSGGQNGGLGGTLRWRGEGSCRDQNGGIVGGIVWGGMTGKPVGQIEGTGRGGN